MEKYDDPKVWELFQRGDTKGIFQLETNLGKQWAKKCQPSNISELAALLSILRPGCLKALSENKSMSQHYTDRKAGKEEITYLHESLRDILEPTYGVLIYQEQCMRIAQKLAGFTEVDSDVLRKAIGKKKADVMAEVRKDFIKGCKVVGLVNSEEAEEIFGWIEKSSRYSFNKCLSPTTIVETPDGIKQLDELVIGDKVLAPSEDSDTFVDVLDIINTGPQETYEVELDDDKSIICTLNHEFLCSDGKKHKMYEIIYFNLEIMCII